MLTAALTLLVTAGTLAATVLLYIVVPKGFLPLQDTSLITAVVEGGPEISFTEMQRLQSRWKTSIRKDPDVAGVVSIVGSARSMRRRMSAMPRSRCAAR